MNRTDPNAIPGTAEDLWTCASCNHIHTWNGCHCGCSH